MAHQNSTLDVCHRGLPRPMQERIRGSRRPALRQTGPHGRPQILHPAPHSRVAQQSEIWEQEQKQLASGGNGCVVVLQFRVAPPSSPGCSPERRAVKVIPVDDKRWKYYLRELDALVRFSHSKYSDFFVNFLGWYKFDFEDQLFIITEYCESGDLRRYLGDPPDCDRLPECEVKEIAWQVLQAIRIMHGEECIHGDIKLNNVLVVQSPPARWKVKVCDLGLSKRVEQAAGDNASTSIHYYSPGYCPPEKILNYDNHGDIDGYKVDMWCFGELVLRALTGEPSFKNPKDLLTWHRTGEGYPDQLLRELEVSEGAIDFLHSVMSSEPANRPTAEAACEHSWWADLDARSPRRPSTPGPSKPKKMTRRSVQDMRLPIEASDARQRVRYPQQPPGHALVPYSPWDNPIPGRAESPPRQLQLQNGQYGMGVYDFPYPMPVPQIPMSPDASVLRRRFESNPSTEPVRDSNRPSSVAEPQFSQFNANRPPLNGNPRASFDHPDASRHRGYDNRRPPGLLYDSYNEPYGPQQREHAYRESGGSIRGPHDHFHGVSGHSCDSLVKALPAQKRASSSVPKEPRRALTMEDLTIYTTGEPVQITVNGGARTSKHVHRVHSRQALNQIRAPENSVPATIGKAKLLNQSPRHEHTCSHHREAQLRKQRQEEAALRNRIDSPPTWSLEGLRSEVFRTISGNEGPLPGSNGRPPRPVSLEPMDFGPPDAQMPFPVPGSHPTPMNYRSQSYPVGQLNPETPNAVMRSPATPGSRNRDEGPPPPWALVRAMERQGTPRRPIIDQSLAEPGRRLR